VLVETRYPILLLMPSDAAADGLRRLAADLAGKGASLLIAAPDGALPIVAADHPATDAVCLVQSFYAMLPDLARRLGSDPDRPRHLHKVTSTR
jgi:glutamine---fructose-6-phosphate transaminase (isomerizing)